MQMKKVLVKKVVREISNFLQNRLTREGIGRLAN